MATEVETLMVRLEASASKFEREMERARQATRNATRDIESRMDTSMRALASRMQGGAASINAALASIGGGGVISVAGITALSDQYARLIDLLKGAGVEKPVQALGDVAKAAISAGAPLQETAELFRALAVAGKETGANYAENIALTELFAKAMASEGKTAGEVADALRSLSSELKYGEGKASDYLEVLQESPRLFDAVAKQLGTTRDKLREMIDEEEISAGKLQQTLLKVKPLVDQTFTDAQPQASRAMASLGTAVQLYVSQTANSIANSEQLAAVIRVVSENFGFLASSAVAVGEAIAVFLVARAILPLVVSLGAAGIAAVVNFTASVSAMGVAATASAAGMAALSGAASLFLNPVSLSIAAVAALAAGLYQMQAAQDADRAASVAHSAAMADLDRAIRLVSEAAPQTIAAVRALGAEQLKQADSAIQNARANLAAAQAMLTAAQAQSQYLSLSGGGEGGMIGAANQAGLETTLSSKLEAENRNLDARVKEREAIKTRLEKFEVDLKAGEFKSKIKPDGGDNNGSGGGGQDKAAQFNKEIEAAQRKNTALQQEISTLGLATAERERARVSLELMQAAERIGIQVSDEQKAKIAEVATQYGNLKEQMEKAQAAQQQFKDLQQFIGTSLSGFFSDVVSGGKNASEALMNLTKKLADAALQAALLGQGPLAGLFGTAGSGGNAGGLMGALFGAFKGFGGGSVATSGYNVTGGIWTASGPQLAVGTSNVPYDDMPARLHKGEMVIPRYDADLIRKGGVSQASGSREVTINVTGTGNAEVRDMVALGVQQGMAQVAAGEQQRGRAYRLRYS